MEVSLILLLDELIHELVIKKGTDVPLDVMARQIDKKHLLYLSVSRESKEMQMKRKSKSVLF